MNDIGKELKELRLLKGLSLKELSDLTRINIKYLEYLEQNNFSFLPEVYVRSFLKSYVKFLGGDEKKFLEMLEDHLHPKPKIEDEGEEKFHLEEFRDEKKEFKSEKFLIGKTNILTFKNLVFVAFALFGIILMLVLLLNKGSKTQSEKTSETQKVMFEENRENKNENFSNFASDDSLTLGISANDSVWIQIKIDDSKIEEVYLRNGDKKQFKAKNDFQLLLGNAGAVVLYLNETELPFTGVKGSVKRLKIDKEGFKLIQVKNELKKQ